MFPERGWVSLVKSDMGTFGGLGEWKKDRCVFDRGLSASTIPQFQLSSQHMTSDTHQYIELEKVIAAIERQQEHSEENGNGIQQMLHLR